MKKFIALLLAMLLVLVNVAALAEGLNNEKVQEIVKKATKAGTAEYSIGKTYTFGNDSSANNVYPTETLEFTVTPDNTNLPVITIGDDYSEDASKKNTFYVDGTKATYLIPVTVPGVEKYLEYSDGELGKFHYTIVETAPQDDPSQGVTYSETTFQVDVYVTYKTETDPDTGEVTVDTNEKVRKAVIYSGTTASTDPSEAAKEDQFENEYNLGELTVTKTIDGNLADPEKEFSITIKLTSDNTIANDMSIDSSTTATITDEDDLDLGKGKKYYEITFTAVGGEFVKIKNIPAGVKYSVVESDATHHIANDKQLDNVNDLDAYFVQGEIKADAPATINAGTNEVEIINTKNISVPTGIALDTVPYILILAVVMLGVALAARKREDY